MIRSSVLPPHPFTYFSQEKVEGGGDFFPWREEGGGGDWSIFFWAGKEGL